MKVFKKTLAIIIIAFPLLTLTAQVPPHPNNGGGPGGGNVPVGGGAPLGGGILIMLALATGYGARNIYDIRNKAQ